MMSALSFKTMLSLNTSEWGLAVEKELSQGATRDEALKTCECMKLHSVDVTQASQAKFEPPWCKVVRAAGEIALSWLG